MESLYTAVGGGGGSFKVDLDLVFRLYGTEVMFVPFSDGEAKVYWAENKGKLALKDLKSLTNYNPLLLNACLTLTDYTMAHATVWAIAQRTGQLHRELVKMYFSCYVQRTQFGTATTSKRVSIWQYTCNFYVQKSELPAC